MKRIWLLFAQTVTVTLAVLFVVSLLRPSWMPWLNGKGRVSGVPDVVTTTQAAAKPVALVPPVAGGGASFREAAKKALPSVVNISSVKSSRNRETIQDQRVREFFGLPPIPPQRSLGSGVIASKDGYVITNNHVVAGAQEIEVLLTESRTVRAKLVGSDPETDLAVLKIDAPDLQAITFGRAEELQIGDVVLAIGDPFGVGQTVTMGIVSALGKGINNYDFVDFIQTDAAINPGNSGGALIDAAGNLVGINSLIYSESGGSQGIGFSIPVNVVKQVLEQIIETGAVARGYFGITPVDIDAAMAKSMGIAMNGDAGSGVSAGGVWLRKVNADSPAAIAGLRPQDILLTINGAPIPNQVTAMRIISSQRPGQAVKVKVRRADKELEFEVRVGKRPSIRAE
jgi:serine protease DegQ